MTIIHNLGFPRIGAQRELKFGLEAFWRGEASAEQLNILSTWLREQHWQLQSTLDYVPVGDFSLYDQVLDMSFTLGHLPERVQGLPGSELDQYFRVARGRSAGDSTGVAAGEMTKWFDTNYHYIVPEFTADTQFKLNPQRLVQQLTQARAQGVNPKPVIIGPVTYLALGKAKDESNKLALLERLLPVYAQLLDTLAAEGVEWVQVDEPILVTELDADWQHALNTAYHQLKSCKVKILLASYFGPLLDNKYLAANLPVAGLHVDATHDAGDVQQLIGLLPAHKVLSLGVISGRNIWKTDLSATLDWLEPLAERLGERLWIAPSCSLLHVPIDLGLETGLDRELRGWLSFAVQKLDELRLLRALVDDDADAERNGNGDFNGLYALGHRLYVVVHENVIARIINTGAGHNGKNSGDEEHGQRRFARKREYTRQIGEAERRKKRREHNIARKVYIDNINKPAKCADKPGADVLLARGMENDGERDGCHKRHRGLDCPIENSFRCHKSGAPPVRLM